MIKEIHGYRRVVPSPKPIKVIQRYMIKDLAVLGNIVIAVGGGGIPIWKKPDGIYEGIEAVVDKDRASALLAKEIGVDLFIILTKIPKVYLNFGKKNQIPLEKITLRQAKKYMKQGHFLVGSMLPKIESAIDYLENRGAEVLITNPENLELALKGREGTRILMTSKQ